MRISEIKPPICTVKLHIDMEARKKANYAWSNRHDCKISRSLWPAFNSKRAESVVALNKHNIRLATGIITGHCEVGYMAAKVGRESQDYCRSCGNEEEEETMKHFLCECPALERLRLRHLGLYNVKGLEELIHLDISDILSFAKATSWF